MVNGIQSKARKGVRICRSAGLGVVMFDFGGEVVRVDGWYVAGLSQDSFVAVRDFGKSGSRMSLCKLGYLWNAATIEDVVGVDGTEIEITD